MRQPMLPLLSKVVFVDWHGVLSCEPFWASIVKRRTHPLGSRLAAKLNEIFSSDSDISYQWMTGSRSSEEVLATLETELQLGRRFRSDFLLRRLAEDCRKMKVNVELFKVLRQVAPRVYVVIATDNIDFFVQTFEQLRWHARRRPVPSEMLASWAACCDDIVCSSDVGKLKSEDPAGFFGKWLLRHRLNFPDALLIDDRADNCAAFEKHGGKAIRWKMGLGELSEVVDALEYWLQACDSEGQYELK